MPALFIINSLILDRFYRTLCAGILALLVFWPLESSFASDFKYFASPPKGKTKLTISSRPKPYKYQILGSFSPVSLLVNGRLKEISKIGKSINKEVLIDKKRIKIQTNSFYHDYLLKTNSGDIEVIIDNGKFRYLAIISTSKFFLDYPIKQTDYIDYQLENSFNLELKDLSSNQKIKLKAFKVGENYLSGEYNGKLLNLPILIKRIDYDKNALQFTLLKKDFNNFPIVNGYIEGHVVYNKRIKFYINSIEIPITDNYFKYEYIPNKKIDFLKFKIIAENKVYEFSQKIIVPNFENGYPWNKPPVQKQKNYFEIKPFEMESIVFDDLNTEQSKDDLKVELELGYFIKEKQSIALSFYKRDPHSYSNNSNTIQYIDDLKIGLNTYWYKNWGWLYGLGLSYHNLRGEFADSFTCNFCRNVESQGALLELRVGHRFTLSKKIELISLFKYTKPVTKMPYSAVYNIELFNLRTKF